jgi:phosphatidylglycerol:prolipoprotein diacylglycerol transferase
MLGIAFLVGSWLFTRELKRKRLDPNLGNTITLLSLIFGIAGSKILYLIESWDVFMHDPFGMAFSPGGLTWYGGLILATIAIMIYTRKRKIPFLKICDSAAPAIMIAYGIGRIGCHLAGDGDYGVPTDLPWGMVYANGTYPPSSAFREFPELVQKYGVNGVVPDTILVHPAPLYEFLMSVVLFSLLWKFRTKIVTDGKQFMLFLVFIARLLVEFIRLNPRILFGLSEAQLISAALIIIGTVGLSVLKQQNPKTV